MYLDYFGLSQRPFSISPDPTFLFPSIGHQEALAHLQYTLSDHSGLVALTGEVGMGKTMLSREFINSLDEKTECAYIFNPQMSAPELLTSLCQELRIPYPKSDSVQELTQALFNGLLEKHIKGIRVLCIIDEAQSMPLVLLEQIRLITNLETNHHKLLVLILVGQPELADVLAQHNMRQLNQRITARYHLKALSKQEVCDYIEHRMACCGCERSPFSASALKEIYAKSAGIPRMINSLADRALLGAYAQNKKVITASMVKVADKEINGYLADKKRFPIFMRGLGLGIAASLLIALIATGIWLFLSKTPTLKEEVIAADTAAISPEALLAQAYQLDASSCEQIQTQNWQCLSLDWPIEELQRLKRPVMINTSNGWQAMGSQMQGQFLNQALILWQPPGNFEQLVHPNERAAVVQWVRNKLKLNMFNWKRISPLNEKNTKQALEDFYDPLLAKAVGDFQAQMGILSDQIIGPQTLLYLQEKDD